MIKDEYGNTVKWIRQNEINDIWEIHKRDEDVYYIEYPRSSEYTETDIYEFEFQDYETHLSSLEAKSEEMHEANEFEGIS